MSNRIRALQVSVHRLDPMQVELRILVRPERVTEGTKLKGRLMGPRCLFSSTVEVAYPLRELSRGEDHLLARVVIPEASLWDPQSPFLYEGPLALVEGEQPCEERPVSLGLRHPVFSPKGFLVNGKPFRLQGRVVSRLTDGEANLLRQSGVNLLIYQPEAGAGPNLDLWKTAARFGMFVLSPAPTWPWQQSECQDQPSHLGWLTDSRHPEWEPSASCLLGMDLSTGGTFPGDFDGHFLICRPEQIAYLPAGIPKLVRGANVARDDSVFGVVQE